MPYIYEIEREKLTFNVYAKNAGDAMGEHGLRKIIHKFLAEGNGEEVPPEERRGGLFDQLNVELARCSNTTEFGRLPYFKFEYEKHTDAEKKSNIFDETGGRYHYDFHISARMPDGSTHKSLGYRITSKTNFESTPSIGVRSNVSAEKPNEPWEGEEMLKKGKSALNDYSVSAGKVEPSREKFIRRNGLAQNCWCSILLVVNTNSLNIFIRRSKSSRNIISFVQCRDVLYPDKYMWLSNGWRESIPNLNPKSSQDMYVTSAGNILPTGEVRLKEYFIMEQSTKNVKWYIPNMWITEESKTNHLREYTLGYNNLKKMQSETTNMYMCLINTLPTGTAKIISIK